MAVLASDPTHTSGSVPAAVPAVHPPHRLAPASSQKGLRVSKITLAVCKSDITKTLPVAMIVAKKLKRNVPECIY